MRYVFIVFSIIFLSILISLTYVFVILKPSNSRNWEVGFERQAIITTEGNNLKIRNVRDYNLENNSFTYFNTKINPSHINKAWFVYEPFQAKPLTGFKGVAHTYFIFDFTDHAPIVISVEARREKGEKYSAYLGMFNKYELIYIWGTENDETIRRVVKEKNKLYMYPLQISDENAKLLLLQLARTTSDLENHPRFYNSLFSNCTNELAKAVNKIRKGVVPFDKALFFPGYSDILLYKLGFIENGKPFSEVKAKYYISDIVKNIYLEKDFSRKLRKELGVL